MSARIMLWIAIAALSLLGSAAFARSLCGPAPADNKCVRGIGQFAGSPCLTLRAFRGASDSDVRSRAMDFASMSRFMENPKQWVGVHNACCTGLMQVNYSNLRNPDFCGCTAQEYAAYTQEQQIDVYVRYLQSLNADNGMTALKEMIKNGQTLGGHIVDGYTLVACAQMGSGNCDAAVANGCSSVAVGEGGDTHVNVCTMADRVRDSAAGSPQTMAACEPSN